MNEIDEVKKILQKRISTENDALTNIAKLVEIVPVLQQQKEEDEFTLNLINTFPKDYSEENAPRWLVLERENDMLISDSIPTLSAIPRFAFQVLSTSSSGTASPYITSGSNLISPFQANPGPKPIWFEPLSVMLEEHTNQVTQKEYIPIRLNKLNNNLGELFTVAWSSFQKCKNGVLSVDLCANHLRAVIQQVWGGLTTMAASKNADPKINTNNLQLSKKGDREKVSSILATKIFPKTKLISLIDEMFDLHYKLSDTRFGKNPLNRDFPLLKIYYGLWLSLMDSISAIVI